MEMDCELGPKFEFPDAPRGNQRSKYGRVQKFNEVVDFLPSDLFRPIHKTKTPKKEDSTSPKSVKIEKQSPPKIIPVMKTPTKAPTVIPTVMTKPEAPVPVISQEISLAPPKIVAKPSKSQPITAPAEIIARRQSVRIPIPKRVGEVISPIVRTVPVVKIEKEVEEEAVLRDEYESQFKVGQLVWGRLSNYPYWPCLVCRDPQGIFYRKRKTVHSLTSFSHGSLTVFLVSEKGSRPIYQIHVRFFGPKGLRSWIMPGDCIVFKGDETSEELRNGKKTSSSKSKTVSGKLKGQLDIAIADALLVERNPVLETRIGTFQAIIDKQVE